MIKRLLVPAFLLISAAASAQCNDLFFSEYLEGASNNKAIEIYNPTSSAINLTDYVIYRYNNGSPTPTDSLFPLDILAAGDVWVAGNPSAVAAILSESDTLHTITFFNGDDALSLKKISSNTVLDIIGIIGVDPGTNWPVGTGATSEFTLTRMIGTQQGNLTWSTAATEYNVHPQNTFDSLGFHTMTSCCVAPTLQLLTQVDVLCNGGNDGSIQVNATGSGPITFSWVNRPETTPFLTGIPVGTYSAVATGACGADTMTFTISEPALLTQTLTASTPSGCTLADGSLTVTPSGGTPGYTYMWSNGWITATTFGLNAGIYTCTVTCANGCTSVETYTVQNTPPPTVNVSLNLDTACTSSVSIALSGGSPAGGVYSGVDVTGDSVFTPNIVGYSVVTYTFTDTNGCTASAMDSVWVDGCMSIGEIASNDFLLSPNPFTDVLTIQFAGSDNVVSIFNMQGQLVYSENTPGTTSRISLAQLPAGVYTIQVVNANGVVTKKIQKAD